MLYYIVVIAGAVTVARELMKIVEWLDKRRRVKK